MSNSIHMDNSSSADNAAWYRHFYVWLIIFLPACAVIASFATLYIAVRNAPDLVVDDYGSIEATVARNIAQDSRATALALRAQLILGDRDATGTAVDLRLQANEPQALPSSVLLRAVHSTQAAKDASTRLTRTAGHYTGRIKLPAGIYDIFLEDDAGSWRLTRRLAGQTETLQLEAPGMADMGLDRQNGNNL